jgi:hypothetical protein
MTHRTLMIMRMEPVHARDVARVFAEHDRTGLPQRIGASARTLFRFHDLYMHLIEAEEDIVDRLDAYRDHPVFQDTNERLRDLLRPYSPTWRDLRDSRAEQFYSCRWD